MTPLTSAAREDAIALFLAAIHVSEPGLVDPPTRRVAGRAPFASADALWSWARTDPALAPIASALLDRSATVQAILDGMLRELDARADGRRLD